MQARYRVYRFNRELFLSHASEALIHPNLCFLPESPLSLSIPIKMATEEGSSSPIEGSFRDSLSRTTLSSRNSGGKPTSEERMTSRLDIDLAELFSANVAAKMWAVATRLLKEQVIILAYHRNLLFY
jgi:hypothetical protein